MIVAAVLLATIAVAFPLWDRFEYAQLARERSRDAALGECYVRCIAVLWLTAGAVTAAIGWPRIFTFPLDSRPAWFPPQEVTIGLAAGICIALVAQVVAAYVIPKYRAALQGALEKSPLLPKTSRERWLFLAVSITAGCTEELIFRGFMIHVLVAWLPGGVLFAMLVASLAFGLAHAGQGPVGAALTGFIGLVLCVLYASSGTLLVPIVVHVLIDARFSLLPARKIAV